MMFQARFWRAVLSSLVVLLGGCAQAPDTYAVPEQHVPFRPSNTEFIGAGDPFAQQFFVHDVVPSEGGPWRWTAAEPELRFFLQSTQNRRLVFEFVINERTFKDTGPVTISFFVNKRLLGRETYDSPGEKSFERPIPADWIHSNEETRVMARIENPWHTPEGVLGILLKRVGFVQ
jgi:hypothetical protein